MVGGTKFPPRDSESGPWSHEQSNTKNKNQSNTKTFHERKNQNLSPAHVSLDNADTVIDGLIGHLASLKQSGSLNNESWSRVE